ncbi:glucans biosynthesis glucosyltransferase MdoH [Gymnodinialimonas ceratoperidinii]|uniref:Glucans biosynthesis glucosyltransferase MdoH n=1 Tax=Gymnodinialimonas ceratoperidinii TaxID=2856823 RepID=A0A8F6TXU2_9RHOB|nr:glucans biosynthesis glucosyltransferase MdoH [Gymnodinialimonas ceratoperidinii]QXT40902.1 glucans biosynthesis glucosyltransferase MdoH [Gymnodinialimonas ceratoperidinii]
MTNILRAEPNMPPEMPLRRPIQNLRADYRDASAPGLSRSRAWRWRLATFLPAFATTFALVAAFTDWFAMGGLTGFETALIALIAITFFWISLSVATVTVGIVRMLLTRETASVSAGPALDVALLVPCYNEVPWDVFGNACAMVEALERHPTPHRFTLFILSDTRDARIAEQELRAFACLRTRLPIHYRRRSDNVDRKVGNIAEWVERWGGGYGAMMVLDADSLMSGDAIVALTDELARDPSAGLIQTFPQLYGAETVFARVQQFASAIYGAVLAEGLATWSDREGNYWGHNAIIRTAAFAACAGLPRVRTFSGKGAMILSHDFVEAGLLRRAGWGVRFSPRIKGSYEEVPATLIDYVIRDQRWCQGNLQHLKLLAAKGFHGVSRFHLLHGAVSYLLSPAWFALLTVWALIGTGAEQNVIRYFAGVNPQVQWPEMTAIHATALLVFMYAMLLAPKALGAAALGGIGLRIADLGGVWRFLASFVTELFLSILYAPILMVQQTVAVVKSLLGIRVEWGAQARRGGRHGFWTMVRFHWLESVAGIGLLAGMGAGIVSIWLLPIAISLAFAVPLSALSGLRLTRFRATERALGTPEVYAAPAIIRAAMAHRATLRDVLNQVPDAAE